MAVPLLLIAVVPIVEVSTCGTVTMPPDCTSIVSPFFTISSSDSPSSPFRRIVPVISPSTLSTIISVVCTTGVSFAAVEATAASHLELERLLIDLL